MPPAPAELRLPLSLPYAVHVERDFARARAVAAVVTGPAGALLLLASAGELVLGVLGLLCLLAALGWLVAAWRGRARGRERATWRLALDDQALILSTEQGDQRVPRAAIEDVSLDEDSLQVVLACVESDALRLEATWGPYGAVDLHALLRAWWRGELARNATETAR